MTKSTPPVNAEQWLDFILAAAAHRSNNEAHRKFGDMLLQRYFVELPARYKDDEVAASYFDEILCVVASAVRGLSIVRDVFDTNWKTLSAAKERDLQRAAEWDKLGPLSKDGYLGRIATGLAAAGVSGVFYEATRNWVGKAPVLLAGAAVLGLVAGALGLQCVVDWRRHKLLKDCEIRFPKDLLDFWEERSLGGYRKVARWFLPLAIEVTERYYPSGQSVPSGSELDALIDRHFAFAPKAKDSTPSVPTEGGR